MAHSGKWRATLEPFEDQAHLVDALDRTVRSLGGLTRTWRFDRMTTVCHPDSGKVTATFAAVAKQRGLTLSRRPLFAATDLGDGHEPEDLYILEP